MGRIRTIKPELLEDAVTAGLTHEAFRLFVSGIVTADDHGNLRADYDFINGRIFQDSRRKITREQYLSILGELTHVPPESTKSLWILYKENGQIYAHYTTWKKHQRVDNASKPLVPIPPGCATLMRRIGKGTKYRFEYEVLDPDEARPNGDGVLVTEARSVAVDVRSLGASTSYRLPTGSYEFRRVPTTSDESAPLDLRSPISDPDQRPPTSEQDGGPAVGWGICPETPSEAHIAAPQTSTRREVDAIVAALTANPIPEVTDRCGGVAALARLLQVAIPAPRPGVDVGEVARLACVQVLGEAVGGKALRAGSLANLVRTVFVRLYTNPDHLAVARGETKFRADGERGVVSDDFAALEVARMREAESGRARDAPRGEASAGDLFKRTRTSGGAG